MVESSPEEAAVEEEASTRFPRRQFSGSELAQRKTGGRVGFSGTMVHFDSGSDGTLGSFNACSALV